jgi:hypothetical protein
MEPEPLLHACVLLWLLGLAAATIVRRARQYVSITEGLLLGIAFWPVRTVGRLWNSAWRRIGKLTWRAFVGAAQVLWKRIWVMGH